jgi:drug/metabolite transporter (DMT)-like permease
VIIAVGAGLASAFFYALCSVLPHRAAGQVPVRGTFSPALMLDLVRHPVWLLGTVSDGAGLSMQALALGFGPVALVQPLLVTGLLFAVVLTATLAHRRPHGSEAAGAVLCVAGVAAFLFAAQPANGVSVLSWRHALAPGVAGLLAAAVCVLAARILRPPLPGVLLATATGILFGLSAALVKVCVAELPDVLALLTTWPLYALIAIGGAGYLLSQNTFQTGSLAAPLATLTVVDPVVSIAVGAAVLHESLTLDGIEPYVAGVALVVMTAGVVVLARHAAAVGATPTPGP